MTTAEDILGNLQALEDEEVYTLRQRVLTEKHQAINEIELAKDAFRRTGEYADRGWWKERHETKKRCDQQIAVLDADLSRRRARRRKVAAEEDESERKAYRQALEEIQDILLTKGPVLEVLIADALVKATAALNEWDREGLE